MFILSKHNAKYGDKNQIYQSYVQNLIEIDKILIKNPEFRKYIYGSTEVNDNTADVDKLMGIMEIISDVIYVDPRFIPKNRKEGWKCYSEQVKKSSAMLYFNSKYGSWY